MSVLPGLGAEFVAGPSGPANYPTFVSNGTYSSGSPASPGMPSGWAVGDVLLLWQVGASEPTIPTGYTHIVSSNNLTGFYQSVSYRIAQSGDTAPTLTSIEAIITAIRGCPASPVDTSLATNSSTTSSSPVTVNGVTTSTDKCMLVAHIGVSGTRSISGQACAGLTSITEQFDNSQVSVTTGLRAVAGATGNLTASLSGNSSRAITFIALKGS